MNIEAYCNHFYSFTYIPIYYYVNGECILSVNSDPDHVKVPAKIEKLLSEKEDIGYIDETEVASYYGYVKVTDDERLIIGPVKEGDYSETELAKFWHIYQISSEDRLAYEKQFRMSRRCALLEFWHLLSMIQETIGNNSESIIFSDVDHVNVRLDEFIAEKYDEHSGDLKINIVETGNRFAPYIKDGDITGLIAESNRGQDFNLGKYSDDKKENQTIIMVIALAYALKAAVEGGMPETKGYLIIRSYIERALKAKNAAEVDDLSMQASVSLVKQMRDYLDQEIRHSNIFDCIQYIRENVYYSITVRDVAKYSGYSEDYFSKLFKKEMGFGAQEFIYNCKLVEARNLLDSTSLSVGDISEKLYFSNQSHFQRRFKNKFGLTPKEYRNKLKD